MDEVRQVVGEEGAAGAAVLRIARDLHVGIEEEAVDDQLPASLEEVEKAELAVRPLEAVLLLDPDHGQPAALSRERVPRTGELLLLDEQRLAFGVPLLLGHDSGWDGHRSSPRWARADGGRTAAIRDSATATAGRERCFAPVSGR